MGNMQPTRHCWEYSSQHASLLALLLWKMGAAVQQTTRRPHLAHANLLQQVFNQRCLIIIVVVVVIYYYYCLLVAAIIIIIILKSK